MNDGRDIRNKVTITPIPKIDDYKSEELAADDGSFGCQEHLEQKEGCIT